MKNQSHKIIIIKDELLSHYYNIFYFLESEQMIYDIIIIGGGIAGLNIAYQLIKKNPSTTFLLLEQSKHLGGRVATYHSETMNTIEMGAGRFSPKHHPLLKTLLKEFGLFDKCIRNSKKSEYYPIHGEDSETKEQIAKSLSKIFQKSKQVPKEYLRQMTFTEYALTILSEKQMEEIQKSFGYYSELVIMNAYDTIQLMQILDTDNTTFYSLQGGFSQLIERMRDSVLQKTKTSPFRYQETLMNILPIHKQNQNQYQIITEKGKIYQTKKCILAIPKESLEKIPILQPIRNSLLSKVKSSSLCRIYSKFENSKSHPLWFTHLPRIMTDDPIRMIIPIDKSAGIIMTSYTDNKYANYWKRIYDSKGMDGLNTELVKHLRKIIHTKYPDIEIPLPSETHIFYWEHGVGYWGKHVNSTEVSNKIIQPFLSIPEKEHIYICGENYSEKHQQWIEGALETSQKVLDKIF
jgi:monoamine oxidase